MKKKPLYRVRPKGYIKHRSIVNDNVLLIGGGQEIAASLTRYFQIIGLGKLSSSHYLNIYVPAARRGKARSADVSGNNNPNILYDIQELEKWNKSAFFNSRATLYSYVGTHPYELNARECEPAISLCSLKGLHYNFLNGEDLAKLEKDTYSYISLLNIVEKLKAKEVIKGFSWNNIKAVGNEGEARGSYLYLFNLQSGNRLFWRALSDKVFSLESMKNRYFVFYWLSCGDSLKEKDEYEHKDRLWAYSRLVRDFLMNHGAASEIDLNGDFKLLYELVANGITNGQGRAALTPKKMLLKVFSNTKASLNKLYGPKFPAEKIFWGQAQSDSNALDYYLVDKSKFCPSFAGFKRDMNVKTIRCINDAHKIIRETEEIIRQFPGVQISKKPIKEYYYGLGSLHWWLRFCSTMTACIKALVHYYDSGSSLKILFVDDNPSEDYQEKLSILAIWFPGTNIYMTKDWKPLITNPSIDTPVEVFELNGGRLIKLGDSKTIRELNTDFIALDLDFDGQPIGFELLRKLRHELKTKEEHSNLIAFSRYSDPANIRLALSSGALFYIPKGDFVQLIPNIYKLRKSLSGYKQKYGIYENWNLLSRLDPVKIAELKSIRIYGQAYDYEKGKSMDSPWMDGHESSDEYRWIKKLPKAELHCHIGPCLGWDVLHQTSLLVLAEKYKKDVEFSPLKVSKIIDFLIPIVNDPYINEWADSPSKLKKRSTRSYFIPKNKYALNSTMQFIIENYGKEMERAQIPVECALLSPNDSLLESQYALIHDVFQPDDYFVKKQELRRMNVSYDEVMLLFIVLLYIKGTKVRLKKNEISIAEINKSTTDHLLGQENVLKEFLCQAKYYDSEIDTEVFDHKRMMGDLNNVSITELIKKNIESVAFYDWDDERLLKRMMSAHSRKRCISNERNLATYLRGCEYGGSAHLQTRAAIYRAIKYIINDYAIKDNIRYLELRCAVDGYNKFGLIGSSPEEQVNNEVALECLIKGINHFKNDSKKHGINIHINLILTGKRHKSVRELQANMKLAASKGAGYSVLPEKKSSAYFSDEIESNLVSFDLCGLEKGHRPSKYRNEFKELKRKCFPITIHAGEEDDAEAIWEAVYELNSQRIGHGLTLRHNAKLLDMLRERHITIELCPISNVLTNRLFKFPSYTDGNYDDSTWKNDQPSSYPLRQYFDETLDVTINTDDPAISDSCLTEEYLVASRLTNKGLTKWEILRLIKNSFKGAAIPKVYKRKLMDEIDEEIFEILLKE